MFANLTLNTWHDDKATITNTIWTQARRGVLRRRNNDSKWRGRGDSFRFKAKANTLCLGFNSVPPQGGRRS
jgi:hypothetical protein